MDNPPTSGLAAFDGTVTARFGMLPNFFRSAPAAPDLAGLSGGYRRELVERAGPYQLQAAATYGLCPDGVHCTTSVPMVVCRTRLDG